MNTYRNPWGIPIDACDLCRFYREEILRAKQSEIADMTGVPQPRISDHEHGRYSPRVLAAYERLGLSAFIGNLDRISTFFISLICSPDGNREKAKNYFNV